MQLFQVFLKERSRLLSMKDIDSEEDAIALYHNLEVKVETAIYPHLKF